MSSEELPWPVQIPDLNPNRHFQDKLELRLQARRPAPTSVPDFIFPQEQTKILWKSIWEAWKILEPQKGTTCQASDYFCPYNEEPLILTEN